MVILQWYQQEQLNNVFNFVQKKSKNVNKVILKVI